MASQPAALAILGSLSVGARSQQTLCAAQLTAPDQMQSAKLAPSGGQYSRVPARRAGLT